MNNHWLYFVIILLFLATIQACQIEKIGVGTNIQDQFYVENQGAKMPVLIEGNIDSGVIVLWVHGGPGGTAIGFQNDAFISELLEPKYAVAYWDQRAAGGSQGTTPTLELGLYVDDLKKVITVLKARYGNDKKVFLLSHSWGGLIAPAFLTEGNNQAMVKGWINVAGAHNYIKNDSLTRDYLLSFGKDQIAKNINTAAWQSIVDYAQTHVPDYTFETSSGLNSCADQAESLIDDITHSGSGISELFSPSKKAFSFFWTLSNAGATYLSGLNQKIMYEQFSNKLYLIKIPIVCISGKYDFTVPRGLADEVMQKAGSSKKNLLILPHSGHICMTNEPEAFYTEIIRFIGANK
jgi:pimeloyl-ACP methyl ester carboxylesterase